MIDNLMLNNFLSRNNLYQTIFDLHKKTQFTYFFMIFGIVDDGDPQYSTKNPIRNSWYWIEGTDTLDTLYNKVNEFSREAKRMNKEFFAIRVEDDENGNGRITLVTKQLISVAAERDKYKIAKDGKPIPPVAIPEKHQMPLECRSSYE